MMHLPITGIISGVAGVTEEWVLNRSANSIYYSRMYNLGATPIQQAIANKLSINTSAPSIASDGRFLFESGGGSGNMRQLIWTGAAFSEVASGNTGNNQANRDIFCPNTGENLLINLGTQSFVHGMASVLFQSAPAYSFSSLQTYIIGSDNWTLLMDFRVSAEDGYGDTIVMYNVSQDMRCFSFSGSTPTSHGTITANNPGGLIAWDRDSGVFAELQSGATSIEFHQVNMTTRALTTIGIGTLPVAGKGICFCKNFLVVSGTDNVTRVYSISGTTLTFVSSVNITFGTMYAMAVSPHSDLIYTSGSISRRLLRLTDAGVISNVLGLTDMVAIRNRGYVFLPSALPAL